MNTRRRPWLYAIVLGLSVMAGHAPAGVQTDGLNISGFLTQGYFYTDVNNIYGKSSEGGSWDFRELGINASYRFTPRLRGAVQLMSRRAGAVDDGSPQIDYALLDYRISDDPQAQYGFRLGRLKIPFGFYNETRDVAFTRPTIMLPQSLYFDQARDLELSVDGGILYSYLSLPGGRLDVDLLYGQPKKDSNVEYAYLSYDAPGSFEESEGYMLRAIYSDAMGQVRIGGTLGQFVLGYQPGALPLPTPPEFKQGDVKIDVAVLSTQYNTERWTLTGEYMWHRVNWDEIGGVFTPRPETTFESYYLQGQYRLSQEWDLVLRYDALFIDKHDRSGQLNHALFPFKPAHAFYSKDWTVGVGWAPTPAWLFRAEYHRVEGLGWLPEQDNPNPGGLKKNWNIYALQATYRF